MRRLAGGCVFAVVLISCTSTGPQGPEGPAGPMGAMGVKGDKGDRGEKGDAGEKGDRGDPGMNGMNGMNGADGAPGAAGTPGTPGMNGTNGVSVTSGPEDAGANCAAGGSRFVSASGTTYACNGQPGAQGTPGPAGPPGMGLNRTVVVPHTGNDAASGAALLAAVAALNPAPPATRWAVLLDPGTYDLGGAGLVLDNVSLSGAGRSSTLITGSSTSPLVTMNNTELSRVRIERTGGAGRVVQGTNTVLLTSVRIAAAGVAAPTEFLEVSGSTTLENVVIGPSTGTLASTSTVYGIRSSGFLTAREVSVQISAPVPSMVGMLLAGVQTNLTDAQVVLFSGHLTAAVVGVQAQAGVLNFSDVSIRTSTSGATTPNVRGLVISSGSSHILDRLRIVFGHEASVPSGGSFIGAELASNVTLNSSHIEMLATTPGTALITRAGIAMSATSVTLQDTRVLSLSAPSITSSANAVLRVLHGILSNAPTGTYALAICSHVIDGNGSDLACP